MKRVDVINHLTFAGYHGDREKFTRLYIENNISYGAAKAAYEQGRSALARGVRCLCPDCTKAKGTTP